MMSKFLHYIFDKDLFAQRIIGLLILIGTIAACCIIKELEQEEKLKLDKKTNNSDVLKAVQKMVKNVENQDGAEFIKHVYLIDGKTFLMTPYLAFYLNNTYEFINYKTTDIDKIQGFIDMVERTYGQSAYQIDIPKLSELKYYYNTQKSKFQAEKRRGTIKKNQTFSCLFNCGKGLPKFDVEKMINILTILGDDCKVFNKSENSQITFQNDKGDKAILMPCRKSNPSEERTIIE